MPVYFFDSDDGHGLVRDPVGLEMDGDEAARDEAAKALAEMARDHIPDGTRQRDLKIWVRSGDGEPLMELAITFAVKPLK